MCKIINGVQSTSNNAVQICVQGTVCSAPLIPFITGSPTAGDILTADLISNIMYQWVLDLDDIPGATSKDYLTTSEDVGHLIRVRMHFTDWDNNFHSVISKPIGPVQGGGGFLNAGAFSANAGGNSITIQMPDPIVSGSLLFVWMGGNDARIASAVAGWTFINNDSIPDAVTAYRIADGTEPSAVTFPYSGNLDLVGQALQFSGVNAIAPIGAHNTNTGSGTTASNAGITTSASRSLVLGLILTNGNQAIGIPAGWTPTADGQHNGSTPYAFGSRTVTRLVSPPGSSGSLSVPISSASWRVSLYELDLD